MLQDVIRDQGLVDTRILVGLEMHKGFLRDALVRCLLYAKHTCQQSSYVLASLASARTFAGRHWRLRGGDGLGQKSFGLRRLHREQIERSNSARDQSDHAPTSATIESI